MHHSKWFKTICLLPVILLLLSCNGNVNLSSYADIDVTDYCTGHDDENIYVLTNQGVLLKHSVDAQKNLLIYNQEFKKTYQSFDYDSFVNFGQSIVLDGYIDRRNIQSTFLSKKTAEPIGSSVIYSFNRPYYITDHYLYRVGGTVNGGEFGLTIQDSSGKEAWTYPGLEKYGSFYPLYDPYEENGIFHVISVDFSGDSFLKHIAIESKSGKVLLEENIASYDENGWWETLSLYDSKRVLWEDHSVFIESYDASGIYVMKMMLQDDYSLKQQWKQYFSTEPLEEANHLTGIYNIHTSSYSGIVVTVNNSSTAYPPGSYVLFLDKENGKLLWKIEDKSVYYPDQVFPTSSYLLLKEDNVEGNLVDLETEESDLLTALNYEDGSVAWQTTIPRYSNRNDQFIEKTIDIADTSAYYSFDKFSKTISRVDALTGTLLDTVLPLQDTILSADFYQVKQSVYLVLSTITKDSVNNVLILRIE
jgi:hypothetical protein